MKEAASKLKFLEGNEKLFDAAVKKLDKLWLNAKSLKEVLGVPGCAEGEANFDDEVNRGLTTVLEFRLLAHMLNGKDPAAVKKQTLDYRAAARPEVLQAISPALEALQTKVNDQRALK